MKCCIFCESTTNSFKSQEHVVPESLGGKDILPEGLVCDNCNKYFGRDFENKALNFEDIKFNRALERVTSKKGKIPVAIANKVEIFNIDRNTEPIKVSSSQMTKTIYGKGIVNFKFPSSPWGPLLRMLLKIGLEYLAKEQGEIIFEPQFSKAKKVVRYPLRGRKWPLAIKPRNPDNLSELYGHKFYRMNENKLIIFEFSYFSNDYLIPLNDEDFEKFRLEARGIDSECKVLNVDIL